MKRNTRLWYTASLLLVVLIVVVGGGTLLLMHWASPGGRGSAGSPATTRHTLPYLGVAGVSTPYKCGPDTHYLCTSSSGYQGTNVTGWAEKYYGCPSYASGCAAGTPHNCTLYVAYRLMQVGVPDPGWADNANNWAQKASSHGVFVDQTPAVGAIAQWNGGSLGHVAYVEASDSNGITITMDDYYTKSPWPNGYTANVHIGTTSPAWPDNFIHFKDRVTSSQPAYYAGKIVQWNGDTKAQKTSWLVSPDLKRYWIRDISTFSCLTKSGFPNAGPISSALLDQLPDQTGQLAVCGGDSMGPNDFLFRGSYLRSDNGLYTLELQRSDGNLVLSGPNGPVWANNVSSDYLAMLIDSNVITYSYKGGITWTPNTTDTGSFGLQVRDDGNLVVINGEGIVWDRYEDPLPPLPTATPTNIPTTAPTSGTTPTSTPTTGPTPPTPTSTPQKLYAEQEGHYGANTFTNPYNASGMGQKIPAGAWVQVVCKVYAPQIQSANPDGYWYLIATSPWNNAYYAVANTFMNGDPWNGPYTHNTDFNVPDC